MRCHAEVPVTWPDDDTWQQNWHTMVDPLTASTIRPDGLVEPLDSTSVRLVSGTHLAPGATYRIDEDRLHSGRLEMTIGHTDRDLSITWSPFTAPGRGEIVVHGLDRLVEVRVTSDLNHLEGEFLFAPRRADTIRLRLRLDWLAVDFTARVTADPAGDRLVGDLAVRGVGLWRPTLAPLLAAIHGRVAKTFPEELQELANSLGRPAEWEPIDAPPTDLNYLGRSSMSPAESEIQIRRGLEEVGRRLRSVATTVAALPWWRRTTRGWRLAAAGLPPGIWPSDDVLAGGTWEAIDRDALERMVGGVGGRRGRNIDAVLAALLEEQLKYRRMWEEHLAETATPDPGPTLTDENLDTRWLRTPWSTLRHLSGVSSEAEVKRRVTAALTGRAAG